MSWPVYIAGAAALAGALPRLKSRLELSKAKHPSLRGHSRIGRFDATLVPYYEYDETKIFRSDDAPDEVADQRHAGFMRLAALYRERFAKSAAMTDDAKESISDLQFTASYRVPFQYSRYVRQHLRAGSFVASSSGVRVTDLDGNSLYDLTGSYGVNVFGYDFYKECIDRGAEHVRALGPVLGSYHPVVAYNARRLREISGLDEVSFHMSGTEAVMQAVRLARYHTKRTHVVRFCGAYHGWWEDVQPGPGNPAPVRDTYTLKDMDEDSMRVLRRRRDIACVLVNPVQALYPNRAAPTCAWRTPKSNGCHENKTPVSVLHSLCPVVSRAGSVGIGTIGCPSGVIFDLLVVARFSCHSMSARGRYAACATPMACFAASRWASAARIAG